MKELFTYGKELGSQTVELPAFKTHQQTHMHRVGVKKVYYNIGVFYMSCSHLGYSIFPMLLLSI